jgi:glyoxylase I family protein
MFFPMCTVLVPIYLLISLANGMQVDRIPRFGGIQHAGVVVSDTLKSKQFYIDVFGFSDDTHLRSTTLPFAGAFLRCGESQIHLMQLPNCDPTEGRPEHGGRDRHIALTISNIDIIKDRLDARGLNYTFSKSGRRALFCRDLDGNAYEFMEDTSLA